MSPSERPIDMPVHLLREAGQDTVCGLKANTKPVPKVLIRFARQHIDGWDMQVCPDCLAVITEEGITL